jgi:epoxyqueuosine reductase
MNEPDRAINQTTEVLFLDLARRGYKGRIVSVQHLQDLQEEIEGYRRRGLFDEEVYRRYLSCFEFKVPESLPGAKSMIIIAVPSPQSQAIFKWNGESRALIIPPTYVRYSETRIMVEGHLREILSPYGYSVASARLPLKLLAVRSGLAQYGKNNISYVPGMGSFLQLAAVFSDLPSQEDNWQDAQVMQRCQSCNACRLKCPTGAIPSDRFLLRAERCIVFHNEKEGNVSFPAWMNPSWHNCLIGCMHCQRVCPVDKDFLGWIEGEEEFSEDETSLILKGIEIDKLPASAVEKLKRLDLIRQYGELPRNLGVFFKK